MRSRRSRCRHRRQRAQYRGRNQSASKRASVIPRSQLEPRQFAKERCRAELRRYAVASIRPSSLDRKHRAKYRRWQAGPRLSGPAERLELRHWAADVPVRGQPTPWPTDAGSYRIALGADRIGAHDRDRLGADDVEHDVVAAEDRLTHRAGAASRGTHVVRAGQGPGQASSLRYCRWRSCTAR